MARIITQRVTFHVDESLAQIRQRMEAVSANPFIMLTDREGGAVVIYKAHVIAIYER